MPILKGLEWTFDTIASAYEKRNAGYVDELYGTLFDYIPINADSKVIEIGSGSGQATAPVLNTGCTLTAIEYGTNFCNILKDKFGKYKNFSVINSKFEDTELRQGTFDLVFSASAFHWIPEEIGYQKVFSMLKSGGAFARFANHPFRSQENPALSEKIDELYARYYYPFHNKKPEKLKAYTEQQAKDRAMIAAKYGFEDIRYALFYRKRVFSAKEYVAVMGTYSDHIVIEDSIRNEFFSEVEKAIDALGGTIVIADTIDLQLARKP